MKPTIPETGRVIRIDGDKALVMLQGGESCRGCGAGNLGLCKPSGNVSTLAVRNTAKARAGDTVTVGLARKTQTKAFLLAFIIPLACLLCGSLIGYGAGKALSLSFLDVLTGFALLLAGSWYSFGKLRELDRLPNMVVKEILSDCSFNGEVKTEEERRFEGLSARC